MAEFVMLPRLSADAVKSPQSLEDLEKKVMERIRSECPQVEWVHNYAVLGPYDDLDVFPAPDTVDAFKVATIKEKIIRWVSLRPVCAKGYVDGFG